MWAVQPGGGARQDGAGDGSDFTGINLKNKSE